MNVAKWGNQEGGRHFNNGVCSYAGYCSQTLAGPAAIVARSGMHFEQIQFIRSVRSVFPEFFRGVSVLEIGSYDVNGSIRPLFEATHYVGVDLIAGSGVDVICPGQDYRSKRSFDVVISTECFEHNPFYIETFTNMADHARPGGLVLFTCAGEGRPEHGTRRCEPASSPGSMSLDADYYKNLTESDFGQIDLPELFSTWRFFRNDVSHDLYFVGLRGNSACMDQLADLCEASHRSAMDVEQARQMLRNGNADGALRNVRLACDGAPTHVRDHLLSQYAWMLAQAGRIDAAEAAIREALSLSDAAELHWQCATILHVAARISAAVEAARRAVDRAPRRAQFVYFLGAMLQAQGKLDEAEEQLQAALRLDPTLAVAALQLSMVFIKQGRHVAADEAARRAAELAPNDPTMRLHLEKLHAQRRPSGDIAADAFPF